MSDLTWDQYCAEAVKTAPQQSARSQLGQAGAGLVDEVAEFLDADTSEDRRDEASDICWYAALACDAMAELAGRSGRYTKAPDTWALPAASSDLEALKMAAAVSGAGESVYWQKANIGSKTYAINVGVAAVCGWLSEQDGIELREAWAANVRKLRDRHGDSWSPAEEQDR